MDDRANDPDRIDDADLPPITPGPEPDTSTAADAEASDPTLDDERAAEDD